MNSPDIASNNLSAEIASDLAAARLAESQKTIERVAMTQKMTDAISRARPELAPLEVDLEVRKMMTSYE